MKTRLGKRIVVGFLASAAVVVPFFAYQSGASTSNAMLMTVKGDRVQVGGVVVPLVANTSQR